MNNWWKAGLLGAGALGLMAATGGTAGFGLSGLLGSEGAAGAAGAAGAGEAAAAGTAAATGAEAAGAAGATAIPGATAFVTPPVTGLMGTGELSGTLAGTDLGYGTAASNSLLASGGAASGGSGALSGTLAGTDAGYGGAAMANAPSAAPSMLQQAGDYAKMGGKAASAYGTVQQGMGGQQAPRPAPMPQPVYQGQATPIAQGLMGQAPQNQFAAMLLAQRQRGMLG